MNIRINTVTVPSGEILSNAEIVNLQRVGAWAVRFALRIVKFSMMSAPLICLTTMLLALWGVVGKATYADLEAGAQVQEPQTQEASNYLVNETKSPAPCGRNENGSIIEPEKESPMSEKIDWEHIV